MIYPGQTQRRVLEILIELLEIPRSYYERAGARHRSLAEFIQRPGGPLAHLDPDIHPQGSFRYGVVNPPITPDDEYDLDNVCVLRKLDKSVLSQQKLKEIYGDEIRAYARKHNMLAPVQEKNRCWRLPYADEVRFHLDTLPCIPESASFVAAIGLRGVPPDLAAMAVAITDMRHPQYGLITPHWPTSNPRGFAHFFEQKASLGWTDEFRATIRAATEDIPPYEWRTALQFAIKIMKRHRDVMFKDHRELAPISMIITCLAAQAYNGETDLLDALTNIVEKMPTLVRPVAPFVPNPTHPDEDYADKWSRDGRLRKNFDEWLEAFRQDLLRLPAIVARGSLKHEMHRIFNVELSADHLSHFAPASSSGPRIITRTAPTLVIPSASKPWGTNAQPHTNSL